MMKVIYQKLLGTFLLLTGSIPLVIAIFFLARQQALRHEMKEKLEEKILNTLVLAPGEVRWIEHNKEIWVNGKMFDVKSWYKDQGMYIFTGLYDEEETNLLGQLNSTGRHLPVRESQLLAQLFQWLPAVCPGCGNDQAVTGNSPLLFYPAGVRKISFPYKSIPTPPPQA